MRRTAALVTTLLVAAALAACGGDDAASGPDYRLITPPEYVGAPPVATPPAGGTRRMTAKDVRRLRPVLAAWAAAVRHGDTAKASRFFQLPAIVYQPSFGAVELRNRVVAVAFNGALPCGARLLSARADGRYIVGVFELEAAKGRVCTTPNETVRVGFVFGDATHPRKFTEWWQVMDEGGPTGPATRPAVEAATVQTFG